MNVEKAYNYISDLYKRSRISGILTAFILIVVIASFASPFFLTAYNVQSLIRSLAFVSIVAIGQACCLLIGEIDLSVGAIAGLCGVIGGIFMVNLGWNPYLSFILCILIGVVFGFVNGSLVSGLNINSLVTTIGMSGIYGGINLVISRGKAITNIPTQIHFLGQGKLFGVPMPFLIMLFVMIVVVIITKYTRFGRYMYALGNSEEAAGILGIKVNKVKVLTFMITGGLSALAGMIMVARLGSSQPSIGQVWLLNSIAAAVIGGVPTTGGIGNPGGALIGASIIAVIENIIVLLGVSSYWQTAVSGVIVVGAISLDSITKRRKG